MNKKFIPYAYANNIFDVDVNFFKNNGFKVLLFDLDNTLLPYSKKVIEGRTVELINILKKEGLTIYICSNNKGKRVKKIAEVLGVNCSCLMRKPFSGPLKRLIKRENWSKDEVILIGDQIQTDIIAGNKAGIRTLLLEPLDPSIEPPWTRFNRHFDRPKREKMRKENLLIDYKERMYV